MEIQELPNKEFKTIILQMLRELQKNMGKQFNDIRKTIQVLNEKFNKEIKNMKKSQTEIMELKNTMTELKHSIETIQPQT